MNILAALIDILREYLAYIVLCSLVVAIVVVKIVYRKKKRRSYVS